VRGVHTFSQGLREYVLVEREVGDQPFQPAVFFLQPPEEAQLAHAHVDVHLFPRIERGVTPPELPAEFADRGAGVCLSDREHVFFFRELRPLHGSTLFFVEDHRSCHRTLVLNRRRFWGRRQ